MSKLHPAMVKWIATTPTPQLEARVKKYDAETLRLAEGGLEPGPLVAELIRATKAEINRRYALAHSMIYSGH